jgi:hypothetical protein
VHKAIVDVLYRGIECFQQSRTQFFRDSQWWFQGFESILRVYDREGKSVAMTSAGAAHRPKRLLGFLGQAATTDGASGKDEFSE